MLVCPKHVTVEIRMTETAKLATVLRPVKETPARYVVGKGPTVYTRLVSYIYYNSKYHKMSRSIRKCEFNCKAKGICLHNSNFIGQQCILSV